MAMTMTAGLLLAPIVRIAITKLVDAATEQVSLACGWKKDLIKFRDNLEMLQGLLQDADEKHAFDQPKLKPWILRIRDVAEEADDLFQKAAYENTRHQVAAICKEVSYYFTPLDSNPVVFRQKMANKVRRLTEKLDEINKTANGLGLQYSVADITSVPEPRARQTHSTPPSHVIGRDQDVKAVVSMLTDDSSSGQKQLPVISIVGMGGLGKTTLAQEVRVSDKICGHFSQIMWVSVSENFEVGRILKEMLESLTRTTCAITNRDALVQEVKQKLAGGTYLLILDDVWNEDGEKWDELRDCLLAAIDSKLGSRVVVTTRIEKVAGVMGTHADHLHHLKGLKDDECLGIIMKRAFGDSNSIPSGLTEIGRAIAKKCGGVPLVASVVGGTLCNNFDRNEWLSIQNEIDARGSLGEGRDRRIVDILKLSFYRLPKPALKQCFVFCSAFPKDSVMVKELLVQLWMAEGYLSPSGEGVSMEDVGREYFNELLAYSLFQEEKRDSFGNVSACKMHDLVHDLASSITEGETVIFGVGSQNEVSEQVRHLNLTDGGVPTNFGVVAEKLRTLFLKRSCSSNLLTNLRRLRVLRSNDKDIEKLPLCLCKSERLSFLDISGSRVKELPEFIGKLYNLQTLRYMNCKNLEGPPVGIENLLNLRHLYFDRKKLMPANIGRLVNLQTLKVFWVGHKKGFRIEELGSLSLLRGKLEIKNLERVTDRSDAERAKLQEKAMEVLKLKFDSRREGSNHDEDVLEGLRPQSTLKILSIEGYGGSNLPSWVSDMRNLVELKIKKCKMLIGIPRLDGFPCLQRLEELDIQWCLELETVSLDGFSRLRKLSIDECDKLRSIEGSISTSTLYCTALESLSLERCGNLGCIPDLDGLTSLKTIYIRKCGQLELLPSGLSSCTALEKLGIRDCENLVFAPKELEALRSLVHLKIGNCPKLKGNPTSPEESEIESLTSLVSLTKLEMTSYSAGLEAFLSSILCLFSIEELDLFAIQGAFPPLPQHFRCYTSLKELWIRGCQLESLPSSQPPPHGLGGLSSLTKLVITNCNLISIPEGLKELPSLVELDIAYCRKLRSFPPAESNFSCLTSLRRLTIGVFSEDLEEFPDLSSFPPTPNLEYLRLWGWEKLTQLPHQIIQHLGGGGASSSSLKELVIEHFDGLEALPEWLGNLSSLQSLEIYSCDNLKHLPSAEAIQRLAKLHRLQIRWCPVLEDKGPEWSKISHIPNITIGL